MTDIRISRLAEDQRPSKSWDYFTDSLHFVVSMKIKRLRKTSVTHIKYETILPLTRIFNPMRPIDSGQ